MIFMVVSLIIPRGTTGIPDRHVFFFCSPWPGLSRRKQVIRSWSGDQDQDPIPIIRYLRWMPPGSSKVAVSVKQNMRKIYISFPWFQLVMATVPIKFSSADTFSFLYIAFLYLWSFFTGRRGVESWMASLNGNRWNRLWNLKCFFLRVSWFYQP